MSVYRQIGGKDSVGCLSDKGNVRKNNEDYLGYYFDENIQLYLVADGMGGHNAGEVASKTAVESCIRYVQNKEDISDIPTVLKRAVNYANMVVYEKSKKKLNLRGMGTTITACLIKDNDVVIANVGDSSCFVIDDNGMEKITKDHSLVQELIDDGSITEEEALIHPNKNIITRALGTKRYIDVDIFIKKVSDVKKIILCTDGLTNEVNREEMYDIIVKNNNREACIQLVELVKGKGGRDNVSVMVFGGEC